MHADDDADDAEADEQDGCVVDGDSKTGGVDDEDDEDDDDEDDDDDDYDGDGDGDGDDDNDDNDDVRAED
eukprot:2653201-Pyramimonas_sp.AAC.1